MRVLVTGATGFLGSHVVEELLAQGHQLRCLVRATSNISFLRQIGNLELIVGSLNDTKTLDVATQNIDTIVHCAGVVKSFDKQELYKANVIGTENLLRAASSSASLKRFIYISSLTADNPVSDYARSKLAAEEIVKKYNEHFSIAIIRPPIIYGPRDRELLFAFRLAKNRIAFLPLNGEMQLSISYVKDVVEVISSLLLKNFQNGFVYYTEDGHVYTWHELMLKISRQVNRKPLFNFRLSLSFLNLIAYVADIYSTLTRKSLMISRDKLLEIKQKKWVCDAAQTRIDLDWQPKMTAKEGLEATFQWYQQNNWL